MNVTRVVFYAKKRDKKSLAVCSVILNDELRLNDLTLFKNENGYFLTLPSRQDVYQEVQALNPGVEVQFPKNSIIGTKGKKKYEEFYHPLKGELYKQILDTVVSEYEKSL